MANLPVPVLLSILRGGELEGKIWHPLRPTGWAGLKQRFGLAWLVFWGQFDAFDRESLERAALPKSYMSRCPEHGTIERPPE